MVQEQHPSVLASMIQCRQDQHLCGGTLQSFLLCLNNIDDLKTTGLGCDSFTLTFVLGKMEDDSDTRYRHGGTFIRHGRGGNRLFEVHSGARSTG